MFGCYSGPLVVVVQQQVGPTNTITSSSSCCCGKAVESSGMVGRSTVLSSLSKN